MNATEYVKSFFQLVPVDFETSYHVVVELCGDHNEELKGFQLVFSKQRVNELHLEYYAKITDNLPIEQVQQSFIRNAVALLKHPILEELEIEDIKSVSVTSFILEQVGSVQAFFEFFGLNYAPAEEDISASEEEDSSLENDSEPTVAVETEPEVGADADVEVTPEAETEIDTTISEENKDKDLEDEEDLLDDVDSAVVQDDLADNGSVETKAQPEGNNSELTIDETQEEQAQILSVPEVREEEEIVEKETAEVQNQPEADSQQETASEDVEKKAAEEELESSQKEVASTIVESRPSKQDLGVLSPILNAFSDSNATREQMNSLMTFLTGKRRRTSVDLTDQDFEGAMEVFASLPPEQLAKITTNVLKRFWRLGHTDLVSDMVNEMVTYLEES